MAAGEPEFAAAQADIAEASARRAEAEADLLDLDEAAEEHEPALEDAGAAAPSGACGVRARHRRQALETIAEYPRDWPRWRVESEHLRRVMRADRARVQSRCSRGAGRHAVDLALPEADVLRADRARAQSQCSRGAGRREVDLAPPEADVEPCAPGKGSMPSGFPRDPVGATPRGSSAIEETDAACAPGASSCVDLRCGGREDSAAFDLEHYLPKGPGAVARIGVVPRLPASLSALSARCSSDEEPLDAPSPREEDPVCRPQTIILRTRGQGDGGRTERSGTEARRPILVDDGNIFAHMEGLFSKMCPSYQTYGKAKLRLQRCSFPTYAVS